MGVLYIVLEREKPPETVVLEALFGAGIQFSGTCQQVAVRVVTTDAGPELGALNWR